MALVFEEGWTRAGGIAPSVPAEQPRDMAAGPSVMLLDSFPGRGQTESVATLAAVIGAARQSVWITNAYFCPPLFALRILRDAVRRGVDVRLLLPGPTDVPLVRHAGHGFFGYLLRRGVKIFEYQPSVLHAKTVVADGYASIIGSSNLDFRSFWFNAECNLLALDDCVGETLAEGFEDDLKRSREITLEYWKTRTLKHRLADSVARTFRRLL
jgi:cardiolipin synthase